MIVIGVDGGGTKTAAVAADLSGRVLAKAEGPGSNPNFVGRDAAFATLRMLLHEVSAGAGVTEGRLAHVLLGVPGLRPYGQGLAEALGLPLALVTLGSDDLSTFYGALGTTSGIVALAGTGSFVIGTNRDGVTAQAGGWGPVIGDEGSGQWIAVRALQAVGLQGDGRGEVTRLTELVLGHYGVADAHGLKSAVKLDNVSRLTYLVREAADAGDAIARAILDEAGRALADMAADVATRLGMAEAGVEVALTGGLPRLGARYAQPFATRLAERCPGARVAEPLLPPVGGALLLALQACGVAWTPGVLERLRQSL